MTLAVMGYELSSHDDLRDEHDRLTLLLELTNSMVSTLDLHEVLSAVMTTSRRVMRSDSAVVMLPDAGSDQLRACAVSCPGSSDTIQEGALIPFEGTLAGHVFRTGAPWVGHVDDVLAMDLKDDANWRNAGFREGCVLPLISRHRVLGTLGLSRRDANPYVRDEVEFLMQIAHQIAIAVENALAYGEIRALKDRLSLERLYLEDEIRGDRHTSADHRNAVSGTRRCIPHGVDRRFHVGRERGAAPEQVAPGHSARAIAQARRGGAAGSQVLHVDGVGGGGGQAEKQYPKKHFRHVECRLPFVDVWGRSCPSRSGRLMPA